MRGGGAVGLARASLAPLAALAVVSPTAFKRRDRSLT
jgi:hypothetical protein